MRLPPLLAVLGGALPATSTLMDMINHFRPLPTSHIDPLALANTLVERGATRCGPAYNNQVCDAGQCCSADGICGTGGTFCTAPACLFQYGPACDANQTPAGESTSALPRPKFGNVPYGAVITHCNTPGKIALTFDDGPYTYTSDLLDLLKTNNVKATFFIVGNNGGKGQISQASTPWPAIIKRAFGEGHQIASHTWSHQDLDTLTSQQISDQVIKNEIALADILGFFPTYIRPPYGRCNTAACQSVLGNLGYHVVDYDLDTLDWQENYPNSQSIFSSAIKSSDPSKSSFIPLTHDIHSGTVHGFVQYMLDTLRAKGYTTALVGECLNDPKENWYRDAKSGDRWSSSTSSSSSSSSNSSPGAKAVPATTATMSSAAAASSKSAAATTSAAHTTSSSKTTGTTITHTTSSHLTACTGAAACVAQGIGLTTVTTAFLASAVTGAADASVSPSSSSPAAHTGAAAGRSFDTGILGHCALFALAFWFR